MRRHVLTGFVSAMLAAFVSVPVHAATVTWDPEGATSLTNLIGSVWTQAGDHVVNIPAGDYTDASYGDWGAQIIWENMGTRSAGNSITIQGAGRASTFLGNSNIGKNGWMRTNNLDMSNITFKDMGLRTEGQMMFGPSMQQAFSVTFDNADVFLGNYSGSGTKLVGKMSNGSTPKVGALRFTNGSKINLVVPTLLRSDGWNVGRAFGETMWFDSGTGIAMWNTASAGAFSFADASSKTAANYLTSLINIDDVYNIYADSGVPSAYQLDGLAYAQGNAETLTTDGSYFTDGQGSGAWQGGLWTTAAAPVPEPSSMALLGMAATVGVIAGVRRRRK